MKKRFYYVIVYGDSRWFVWSEIVMYAAWVFALGALVGAWTA